MEFPSAVQRDFFDVRSAHTRLRLQEGGRDNTWDFGKLEGASSLIVLTETVIITSLLLKLFGALKQIVITASPSTIFETIANEY